MAVIGDSAFAYCAALKNVSLPDGLTAEKSYQTAYGLSYGSYQVEKDLTLSGAIAAPGTYEITLTLQVPAGGVTGGWVGKLWFTNVHLGEVSRTITLIVE